MMNRITAFARSNAIALTALFVALGGTSYAAISIPAGAVGTKQIRNGAVTPVKLDGGLIGGDVRAWAYLSPTGKLLAGDGFRSSVHFFPAPDDQYGLVLVDQNARGCAATASAVQEQGSSGPTAPGSAVASLVFKPGPVAVTVSGYGVTGQPAPLAFVVQVLC